MRLLKVWLMWMLTACYALALAQGGRAPSGERAAMTPAPTAVAGTATDAVFRLGMLGLQQLPADQPGPYRDLLDLLATRGFEHGRNLQVLWAPVFGTLPELQDAAQALVAQGAQVILAAGNGPALAASRATRAVPIVAWASGAVAAGLVASLQRPGGNVTGIDTLGAEVSAKRMELVRAVLPGPWPAGSLLGVLFNPDDPGAQAQMHALRDAAARVGIQVQALAVRTPQDIDRLLQSMSGNGISHGNGNGNGNGNENGNGNGNSKGKGFGKASSVKHNGHGLGVRALVVLTDALTASHFHAPRATPDLAVLPTFCELPKFVLRGCLVAFGPSTREYVEISARLVARLFHQPADAATLPMEHTRRFELVLNQQAARQLALTLPPTLLARADSVFEGVAPPLPLKGR